MSHPHSPIKREVGFEYCAVSGEKLPRERMLRFVVAPQGFLGLDLKHRLTGEAFWVAARHDAVTALSKKMVAQHEGAKHTLARKTHTQLQEQVLARLSLARKAGQIVIGFSQTKKSLAAGRVGLLLSAFDGSVAVRKKLETQARAKQVPICAMFGAARLGAALGRGSIVHAGVVGAAQPILAALDRLQNYCGTKGRMKEGAL